MKFIIPLLFSLLVLILFPQDERTLNFPRQRVYVDTMPPRENTWVFILAGQSNMAGRGMVEPMDTVPDCMIISILPDNRWVVAKEPLQLYQPALTGLGPGLAFARVLAEKTNHRINIALVPCAVGGSSIDNWLSDSLFNGVRLKSNFIEKMSMAKEAGTVKAIIWHQGESDATAEKSEAYKCKLKKLFGIFRQAAGNDTLPVIMGELALFPENSNHMADYITINKILTEIASEDPSIALVSSEGLKAKSDNVHFDGPSQRLMGKRYADAYLTLSTSKK